MSTTNSSSLRWWARAIVHRVIYLAVALVFFVPVLLATVVARFVPRRRVGLGPEPLINNVHHAKALRRQGYETATFVSHVYFITSEFDVRWLRWAPLNHYALYLFVIFRCRILYIYFNGGPLAWTGMWAIEPLLYRLAGTRVVVMPYGGDVQDFNVHDDVVYRAAYLTDYPDFIRRRMRTRRKQVKRWTRWANWIISGCDWVNYTPYWDTLMLAHFSVDTDQWSPPAAGEYELPARFSAARPLRVLHAPNHRKIKGTGLIERAIAQLRAEGVPIELQIVQRVSNAEMRAHVRKADMVVEQLVIGWYGIFALEAMAAGKPVMTYIAPELERLYVHHELLDVDELPVLRGDYRNLKATLREIAENRRDLAPIGRAAREFVLKHHSLDAVGREFAEINSALGVPASPAGAASAAP
jgi:glycosyltransferase involved in cell wall biosynthesis